VEAEGAGARESNHTPGKDLTSEPISISTPREEAITLPDTDIPGRDVRKLISASSQEPQQGHEPRSAREDPALPSNDPQNASSITNKSAASDAHAAHTEDAGGALQCASPLMRARDGGVGQAETPRQYSRASSPRREGPGLGRGAVLTETPAVISIYHGADNRSRPASGS
jgi:hypothetical protein